MVTRSVSESAKVNSRRFGSSPAEICGDLHEPCGSQRLQNLRIPREKSFDVSVFYVWRIAQEFGVSARILAYQQGTLPTFGVSICATMGSGAV